MKRLGHDSSATLEDDVVAGPAEGNGASPQVQRVVPGRPVYSSEMERDEVARPQVERNKSMLVTFGVDIGHHLKAVPTHRIVVINKHLRLEQASQQM